MAIKSTPFGPLILSGSDAERFIEQMGDPVPEAARRALERALLQQLPTPQESAAYQQGWMDALERAALTCEQSQSNHRMGGPDAARRNCAILIRDLKTSPFQRSAPE